MKTVLEVIQATTTYFAKYGVENPRLNIEHLLAHVLGMKRMQLYLEFDRPLSDKELEPLRDLVKRRSAGEPLQHLLGTVEFLGHVFTCDKRGLIARESPCSNSTNSFVQRRCRSSSRVTISPGCSSSMARTANGCSWR